MKEALANKNKQPSQFVDLEDFLRVIIKRKFFIVTSIMTITLIVLGINLILQKYYKVEVGVDIGQIMARNLAGKDVRLVSSRAKIHSILSPKQFPRELETLYGFPHKSLGKISAGLNILDQEVFLLQVEAKSPEQAVAATEKVLVFLNNLHQEKLAKSRASIEERIKKLDVGIQKIGGELASLKSYMQQLTTVGSKNKSGPEAAAAILLYSQLSQKEAYLNLLEEKKVNMKRLKAEIVPFRFIAPLIKPMFPYRPRKILNTAVAFAVSFIFFLILACFLEYLERIKKNQRL